MKLVLASTSRYRAAQLTQMGADFSSVAPTFDEDTEKQRLLSQNIGAQALSEALAKGKAESLLQDCPNSAILGGDQLVELDGAILGKPGSRDKAIAQLMSMCGREHQLITSVYLALSNEQGEAIGFRAYTDITRLWMRELSEDQISHYVMYDQPEDCAGGYKLESAGISLFEKIDSQDSSAIQGLPLLTLGGWFSELELNSLSLGRF